MPNRLLPAQDRCPTTFDSLLVVNNRLSIHYQSDVDKNNKKPRYTYQGRVETLLNTFVKFPISY
jgi:hypothetical protein